MPRIIKVPYNGVKTILDYKDFEDIIDMYVSREGADYFAEIVSELVQLRAENEELEDKLYTADDEIMALKNENDGYIHEIDELRSTIENLMVEIDERNSQ